MNTAAILDQQTEHRCEHCQRVFRRSSSLVAHLCEPARRHRARNERGVQIAFQAFLAFYRDLHGSSRLKTLNDFDVSPYYRAFVRFGHYCVNTRVIDPDAYLHWLLTSKIKIDHWAQDQNYTEFLQSWLCREPADRALRRGIEWAECWAHDNHSVAQHCLKYGNANVLCHAIVSGRLSAWLLYNCDSGQEFLGKLTSEQIEITWPYIDSDQWQRTFRDHVADQLICQTQLAEAGW